VKVRMEDSPETISVFQNTDIVVGRSGKAKKNDAPIPADWAPISGSGKRVRRRESEEKLLLEPIRFRYSTEKIVEEEAVKEELPAETSEPKPSRSRRRRQGGNKEKADKTEKTPEKQGEEPARKQEKQPKTRKESKPAAQEPGEGEPVKKNRRRPNHRRHKPKSTGENQ